MADQTAISWCDYTFNPLMGCTKVSPACAHCYAERDFDHRYGKVKWGPNGTRVVTSDAYWSKPLKWNAAAAELPSHIVKPYSQPIEYLPMHRPRVFCASLADVFEQWDGPILNSKGEQLYWFEGCWIGKSVDASVALSPVTMDDVRRRLFSIIDATPHLDWLLLTKRPENIHRMWIKPVNAHQYGDEQQIMRSTMLKKRFRGGAAYSLAEEAGYRSNVWLGTTSENQEYASRRIPELLKCREKSPVLFLSCEPLLGPIEFNRDGGWLVPWEKSDGVCGPEVWNGRYVCARGHAAVMYLKSEKHGGNVCLESDCRAPVHPAKPGIDWVIAGGESGKDARPSHISWFRSIRDQCAAAGVPWHFKQFGEWVEAEQVEGGVDISAKMQVIMPDGRIIKGDEIVPKGKGASVVHRVGTKKAGRTLDGVIHDAFPVVKS